MRAHDAFRGSHVCLHIRIIDVDMYVAEITAYDWDNDSVYDDDYDDAGH